MIEEIRQNVAAVRARMEAAARLAGRDPESITLCAASKMNGAERVLSAVEAGVDCCGENRVQELREKKPQGAYGQKPLHFIGRLQTNKVKFVVGEVDLIESVDRLELLEAIEKQAARLGVTQRILLEVNVAGEETKAGFAPEEVEPLCQTMASYPHVRLCGLMAIPPVSHEAGENFIYFQKMYTLWVDIRAKKYDNVTMDCLSMGMSDDFEDAIACGSTMVRVGTAIFGRRNYAR